MSKQRWFLWTCIALVVTGGLVLVAVNRNGTDPDQGPSLVEQREREKQEAASDSSRVPSDWVDVGGVKRPASSFASGQDSADVNVAEAETVKPVSNVGRSPHLNKDLNPHVASVAQATETGKFPERLSAMIRPKPFDRESYLEDPEAYLNVVEPGRVFQIAQRDDERSDGEPVEPIREDGQSYFEILQGESVVLKAWAEPQMPVTFYSNRLGQFSNKLTSITVAADQSGLATAVFTATAGTRGEIDILAGSPTSSGQGRYLVKVSLPMQVSQASQ